MVARCVKNRNNGVDGRFLFFFVATFEREDMVYTSKNDFSVEFTIDLCSLLYINLLDRCCLLIVSS